MSGSGTASGHRTDGPGLSSANDPEVPLPAPTRGEARVNVYCGTCRRWMNEVNTEFISEGPRGTVCFKCDRCGTVNTSTRIEA